MSMNESALYCADVYKALAQPFDETHHDNRGGIDLEYITGEQCIRRLSDVLGLAWNFEVREHGINPEADEAWVLGRLTLLLATNDIVSEQFGSQKLRRQRSSGNVADIGFDLKGAATDSLKKCAMRFGVGLYLSKKEGGHPATDDQQPASAGGAPASGRLECVQCDAPLGETRFKDGKVWTPAQLAGYGRSKFGRVLCMDHYTEANAAKKAATGTPANATPAQNKPVDFGPATTQNGAVGTPGSAGAPDSDGGPSCANVIELLTDPWHLELEARKRNKPNDLLLLMFCERIRKVDTTSAELVAVEPEIREAVQDKKIGPGGQKHLAWLLRERRRFLPLASAAGQQR